MNRQQRWAATQITTDMQASVALTIYRARLEHPQIDEDEFLTATLQMCEWYGWELNLHIRPARTKSGWETPYQGSGKGFPDVFAVRPTTGHRFAAELKVGSNEPTADQERWLDGLERYGIPAFTWWPTDVDEILDVLNRGAEWPAGLARSNLQGCSL